MQVAGGMPQPSRSQHQFLIIRSENPKDLFIEKSRTTISAVRLFLFAWLI
jgi:hypothetical protein